MDRFFPVHLLKSSFQVLKTQNGLVLVGINLGYMLVFGIINLLAGLIIFGPATLLLHGQSILIWIVLPFLSLVFAILMTGLTICVQYLVFLGLYRMDQNLSPMLSIEIIQKEGDRFKLYVESIARAILEVVLGLVFLIIPGVILLLKYILIGPVAIFQYTPQLSAQDVLAKSSDLTHTHRQHLGYLLLGAIALYLLSSFILGGLFTRIILAPLLLTFLAIVLVKYYQMVLKD